MKNRLSLPMSESPWLLRSLVATLFLTVTLIFLFSQKISPISTVWSPSSSSCSSSRSEGFGDGWIPNQVSSALLHYATTTVIPQQNRGEIDLTVKVLRERSPCNFLVFGLGRDSPLWNALNFKGKTVFLEEDFDWIKETVKKHPQLEKKAFQVKYPTTLSQADNLLRSYRSEISFSCNPWKQLRGSTCKLALANLPGEIYETEWDVIMIDAPRGYFDAAPGRMTAIFSAAVMAKNRKKKGATDVFLHDVDRRVEKTYAHEFLCKQNLVASSGRLWHFRIAPFPSNATAATGSGSAFCP